VALAVLVAGCSQTRMVNTTSPASLAESRINRVTNNRLADVDLVDGRSMYAVDVEVGIETTSWVHPTAGDVIEMPTSQIERITVVRAGQGALLGLGAGVILGGTFGFARALIEGDDPPGDPLSTTRGEKMYLYPAAHAVYASIGTTAIGAIVGRKVKFQLTNGSVEDAPTHIAGDPQP